MLKAFALICLFSWISLTFCSKDNPDESVLPDFPYTGKTYSGYLNLKTPGKALHYLFQPSSGDQTKDPLVIWLNGGPGCSSMLGWAQEHGPGVLEDDLTFKENPYSWNKVANMIYLESPAGVGYSYVTKESDIKSNDVLSGLENLQALLQFFTKYPAFKINDFYIAGESYAGIYVPTLAKDVLDYNKSAAQGEQINLKGIMVGNGVTDWRVDTSNALYDLAYSHALISLETRAKYEKYCKDSYYDEEKCNVVKAEIQHQLEGVNIYDIYRKCYLPDGEEVKLKRQLRSSFAGLKYSYKYTPWLFKNAENDKHLKFLNPTLNSGLTPPCVDSKGPDWYFNRADVKKALHVKEEIKWEICSDDVGKHYTTDYNKGSLYIYPTLIQAKLKILIFSGDTDGAVPINGTMKWIYNLNLPIAKPWRSWIVDKQVAGYTEVYQGLNFVSVKGVGHMVPQWARERALHMFSRFLADEDM